jgi:uncharacterized membrane protein YcaP (DUF421 family)
MEIFNTVFGVENKLDLIQMVCRGIVLFFIALILIRVSGRRSFGIRTPLDNVISILLGAVLSRAVVGASPFVPVVVTCFAIVILHRLFGWLVTKYHKTFGRWLAGQIIVLFEHDEFKKDNMRRAMVSEEDIMQGIRKTAMTEDMTEIEKVYMERNGEISAIKKKKQNNKCYLPTSKAPYK